MTFSRIAVTVLLGAAAMTGSWGQEGQVLPPVVAPLPQQTLAGSVSVFVREIVLMNGSVFSHEELEPILAPYLNRELTNEQLQELRQRLSLLYFDAGYVNSGVVLPDQNVTDGRIVFQEVRGNLSRVELQGNRHLRDRYLTRRIADGITEPLNVNDLQRALRRVQQDPLVEQINAELLPGDSPGASILQLSVREVEPFFVRFGANNYRPPGTGAEQLTLSAGHRDLTGNGDSLALNLSYSAGLLDGGVSYSVPLHRRGTRLAAYYAQGASEIVEEPFDAIDIETETNTLGFSVFNPLLRRPSVQLAMSWDVEVKHSESTLLGIPFSFSRGEQAGESDLTATSLGLDWTGQRRREVTNVRLSVRQGLDIFGATSNEGDLPDGRFTLLLLQAQYARLFSWQQATLLLRTTTQLSQDPLLSMEKFAVGGIRTVRGYRENLFVRDNAWVASVEYRIPLSPADEARPLDLQFVPFIDYGRSWNEDAVVLTETQNIASAGLGLLWSPLRGLHAELYWGYAFDDTVEPSDPNRQDDGVHFSVSYDLAF